MDLVTVLAEMHWHDACAEEKAIWQMLGMCMGGGVISERLVRHLRDGRNQAVRIPRGFELPVDF